MKILSIETSCDETAVSIVEATGDLNSPSFTVLGNALFSQIEMHKEYGGVYPMLAKREHAKNLPSLLQTALTEASLYTIYSETLVPPETWSLMEKILEREEGLYEGLKKVLENIEKPNVDVISVTSGPGLEPALWVGISCAVALGKLWGIPVVPINHMEGHIASVLIENTDKRPVQFPALALLISGGHTEIVSIEAWGKYLILGQTRDDAVGEAFDKTARMMGLPYPGGKEISELAEFARKENLPHVATLPRPMLHSDNLDFSFAGLKTAVLYYIDAHFKDDTGARREITKDEKADLSREIEDAVIDVLTHKVHSAIEQTGAHTLLIGGGVIANKRLRETFERFEEKYTGLIVKTPTRALSTDNSLMIASATYIKISLYPEMLNAHEKIIAKGNLKLGIESLN